MFCSGGFNKNSAFCYSDSQGNQAEESNQNIKQEIPSLSKLAEGGGKIY